MFFYTPRSLTSVLSSRDIIGDHSHSLHARRPPLPVLSHLPFHPFLLHLTLPYSLLFSILILPRWSTAAAWPFPVPPYPSGICPAPPPMPSPPQVTGILRAAETGTATACIPPPKNNASLRTGARPSPTKTPPSRSPRRPQAATTFPLSRTAAAAGTASRRPSRPASSPSSSTRRRPRSVRSTTQGCTSSSCASSSALLRPPCTRSPSTGLCMRAGPCTTPAPRRVRPPGILTIS
ncbi:hypothetical protein DFH07DRAFT_114300 [Mycena maculata]|uniref:Uncharacterized protein n=1 Tax=Mycena maculata TaxID=230809 RepID=A0AAD7I4R4_9AGAR|nr:hypothetical protein DFH07DRAFT_114300 [Mycena maculata]